MKSEGGREVGNKGWRRQHEINATTFNFWFRLEGRIFGKSEVFKRNWKGKGDERGRRVGGCRIRRQYFTALPTASSRFSFHHTPFALRCASPIDSGPFAALAEWNTQTRYHHTNSHCSSISLFSSFCMFILRRHLLFPNQYVLPLHWIGSELNRKLNCSKIARTYPVMKWRCVIPIHIFFLFLSKYIRIILRYYCIFDRVV